jgi:hypothetical protein
MVNPTSQNRRMTVSSRCHLGKPKARHSRERERQPQNESQTAHLRDLVSFGLEDALIWMSHLPEVYNG